jgi:hypothetical protein
MATLDNEEVKLIAEALVDAGIVEQELPLGILFSSKLQKLRLILQSLIDAKVLDQEQDAACEKANTKTIPMDLSPHESLFVLQEALSYTGIQGAVEMHHPTAEVYSLHFGAAKMVTGPSTLSLTMAHVDQQQLAALINYIRKFAV